MFGRWIWDKLSECIFENFEIARVKRLKRGTLVRISPYSVQMQGNTDQENYKYGHFSRSVGEYQLLNKHKQIR